MTSLDLPGHYSLLLRMIYLMCLRNWLRFYKMKTDAVLNPLEVAMGKNFKSKDSICLVKNMELLSFSSPRTPQQNGVVERKNRSLK